MAYNSRHSIFLHNNDKQKLLFLKSLLDEEDLFFVLQEETVYQYDGEPLTVPCISDINWNYGDGYVWHDFEQHFELTVSYGDSGRNYNNLPYRIKAQQILYEHLLEKRKAGKLRP